MLRHIWRLQIENKTFRLYGLYKTISAFYGLTFKPPNYLIENFTHLKSCPADAIHNFKWVKIIQIWQNWGQLFWNLANWCYFLSLTSSKAGM